MVFLRVVISFFILGSCHIIYANFGLIQYYALIGGNVLVTIISAIFIERLHSRKLFLLFQIYWDYLFVTALIYLTGGYFSLFSFMYILTVIFAATLTSQLHTIWVALLCSLSYGFTLVAQFHHWIEPLDLGQMTGFPPSIRELSGKIMLNSLAFIIAGILASALASSSRAADAKIYRQQQEMDALKALNDNIVQSLPIGLLTSNEKNLITFANANAIELLGHAQRGKDLTQSIPMELSTQGKPVDISVQADQRASRILSVIATDLRNASRDVIGRMVTLQDVTTVRKLEQDARQADRLAVVGKLAAGIAHEIRNPLASISGSIQVLQNELQLDDIHSHLMDIVVRETDRLNKLLTDFLVYARPDKRAEKLDDLSAVLEEQLGMVANDPKCHDNIKIDKKLQSGLICRFDRDQVRQLFLNLLMNAIHSMADRKGTLSVTTKESEEYPGFVEVRIQDAGVGIEPEDLRTIFDPFYTTKEDGTGLGLTIAHRIVENHNGKILVESKIGQGTTFTVLLPA
ncbi:MAG TPA: ATP-binding protein [bacterium]|nr:ATP-binding protein [bacterium]